MTTHGVIETKPTLFSIGSSVTACRVTAGRVTACRRKFKRWPLHHSELPAGAIFCEPPVGSHRGRDEFYGLP